MGCDGAGRPPRRQGWGIWKRVWPPSLSKAGALAFYGRPFTTTCNESISASGTASFEAPVAKPAPRSTMESTLIFVLFIIYATQHQLSAWPEKRIPAAEKSSHKLFALKCWKMSGQLPILYYLVYPALPRGSQEHRIGRVVLEQTSCNVLVHKYPTPFWYEYFFMYHTNHFIEYTLYVVFATYLRYEEGSERREQPSK